MNRYLAILGDRNALEIIEQTARKLYEAAASLRSSSVEWRPAPGKWNAREIICHLADCEIVFAYRLRQTTAEDHHVIQPFDQEKWAGTYGAYELGAALDVFSSVRHWNIALIRSLPPPALAKRVKHPERGDETFQTIVDTMAGHDINHLQQIDGILSAFAQS